MSRPKWWSSWSRMVFQTMARHRQATRGAWRLWSVCCPPILQPSGAAPIDHGKNHPSTGNGKFIICHAWKMINMVLQNFVIKNGGFENDWKCTDQKWVFKNHNKRFVSQWASPWFPGNQSCVIKRGSGTPYTLRFYWENHIINYDSLIQLYHYQLRFNPSITRFCVTTLSLNPQLAVSGSNYDWLIDCELKNGNLFEPTNTHWRGAKIPWYPRHMMNQDLHQMIGSVVYNPDVSHTSSIFIP